MARRPDVTERLAEIDVPALLLCGVDDVISPPAEMRAMAARMPRAGLVEIPDAGHMAPVENPQAVAAALCSFLEQVSGD
jgi:pimeloyl-ACP methyl ester carboxylesterase